MSKRINRSEFVAHRELKHATQPVTRYTPRRRRSRDGSWALALLRIFGLIR